MAPMKGSKYLRPETACRATSQTPPRQDDAGSIDVIIRFINTVLHIRGGPLKQVGVMAGGVSKAFESTWVYHPGGDRFEDRVGAILSRGINLQETFKQQALHTAKKAIAFENEQKNPSASPQPIEQTVRTPPPVDMRGLTWVTKEGETLGAATEETFADLPPPPTPKQTLSTDSQKTLAHMNATQRSMHIWKKVNPGCLEVTTQSPHSTYKDHFTYQGGPVNKERFRMKSDFTSYADQAIRYSQGVKNK